MNEHDLDEARYWEQGWRGHELAQLRRMARLPLSEKLVWLEEAHRFVEHLRRQSREEIRTMLVINDIRESRAYQEAVEEGMEKGVAKGIEKAIAIAKLAAQKKSVAEIAAILQVKVELVNRVLAQGDRD